MMTPTVLVRPNHHPLENPPRDWWRPFGPRCQPLQERGAGQNLGVGQGRLWSCRLDQLLRSSPGHQGTKVTTSHEFGDPSQLEWRGEEICQGWTNLYCQGEGIFRFMIVPWFICLDFFPMLDEPVRKFSGKDGHVWKWWLHGEGLYFGIHFWLLRFHVAFQEFQDYYQDSYMKEWANGVPEKKMAEDWKAYTVPQI